MSTLAFLLMPESASNKGSKCKNEKEKIIKKKKLKKYMKIMEN